MRSGKYIISEHTGICEGWDEGLLRKLKSRSRGAELIYKAKMHFNIRATAVYNGDMKLMHYFKEKRDELYNIVIDPEESENIIGSNRALANDMARHAYT